MSKRYVNIKGKVNGQSIKTVVDLGFATTVSALERIRTKKDKNFANFTEKFRRAVALKFSIVLNIPVESVVVDEITQVGSYTI